MEKIPLTQNQFAYIYGLYCPVKKAIRYIGKSDNPERRFKYHHLRKQELEASTHKSRWIKKLLKNNLKPKIIIIEKVLKNEWQMKEKYWINYYKKNKYNLTNETIGGDGREGGFKHKPESIKKIIKSLIGRKLSDETKKKISESNKKFKHIMSEKQKIKNGLYMKNRWENKTQEEKNKSILKMSQGFTKDRNKKISENNRFKRQYKNNSSKYRGVNYIGFGKRQKRWRAYIFYDNKQINLGYFITQKKAAQAYNEKAKILFGEYAYLNEV